MAKAYLKHQFNYVIIFFFVIFLAYTMLQVVRAKSTGQAGVDIEEIYKITGCDSYDEYTLYVAQKENELYALQGFDNYTGDGIIKNDIEGNVINHIALDWFIEKIHEGNILGENRFDEITILQAVCDDIRYESETKNRVLENIRKYKRFSAKYGNENHAKKTMYDALVSELEAVKTEFDSNNTYGISMCLKSLENITVLITMTMLLSSFFFSEFFHNNLSKQMLSSPLCLNWEALKTFVISSLISTVFAMLIFAVTIFVWHDFVFAKGILSMPIQSIQGYANITYSYSVYEYIIFLVFLGIRCVVFTNAFFQLFSWISKNVIISVSLSLPTGFVLAFYYNDILSALISNNIFIIVGDSVIRKDTIATIIMAASWLLCATIVFSFTRMRIRRINLK